MQQWAQELSKYEILDNDNYVLTIIFLPNNYKMSKLTHYFSLVAFSTTQSSQNYYTLKISTEKDEQKE